ncbi:MAG TPA: RcnB family protein [Rhizomicrobium sp.]|nr:RcnB family protein [Rhizomicrobium sp.]
MNKWIIPAFALALAAGAPSIVWAQDQPQQSGQPGDQDKDKHHHNDNSGQNQPKGAPGEPGMKPAGSTMGGPNKPNAMSGAEKNTPSDRDMHSGGPGGNTTPQGSDWKKGGDDDQAGDHDQNDHHDNDRNAGDRHDNDHHDGDRGDHHGGRANVHVNIDLGRYRAAITAGHHFRIGVYHAPPHYVYRRWAVGQRLPAEYFVRDYWLTDWAAYDLMSPPDGYVWVRFGPDALLIDEDSGEVIRVVYGVFI